MTTPEEQAAEVLAAHRHYRVTAGWNGSPDPRNYRNMAETCTCGERVCDLVASKADADKAHRAHVAEALAPLFAEERRKGAEEALREAADDLDRRAFGGTAFNAAARIVREWADTYAEAPAPTTTKENES
jgi:uncharacterized protein (DUF2336 family)